MKGFVTYSTYEVIDEKTYIQLFGKLDNAESFVIQQKHSPYFYVKEKDIAKIKSLLKNYKIEKTNMKDFSGNKVTKIISNTQADQKKLSSTIHKKDLFTYEADIKPTTRFMIDKEILGPIEIEGDYERTEKVDRFYNQPKIKPLKEKDYKPKLKTISIDLESDKNTNKLFCIGLYGENYEKNFLISNEEISGAISCKDEYDLLTKFKKELIKIDPDIITGWHVIDFDLAYLKQKFLENRIQFDLGRTNRNCRIKLESNFFKKSTADMPGRQVLDGLNSIKDPYIRDAPSMKKRKFQSMSLENVSQEILGEGKTIKGKERHDEITKLYENDKKKLVEYNIKDCKLAYDILEKTKILDIALERASLTGMPLNKITASIASFDSLYIREAKKKKLVSPTTFYTKKTERIRGGYVMESKPGIYHNLLVLDFKSLYPSIIKTFNIDPASYLESKEKNSIESPNKAYFKNQEGILPEILEKLHQERERAKSEKRDLSSYAIKIIMNSFFGVLASPNCRYYSLKMANAITHFGQEIIKLTAKKIEKLGYPIIYSDTDSVFVNTNLSKEKAEKLGNKIEKDINEFYKDYVKKKFKRKSFIELEYEKLYLSFLIPKTRGTEKGSKKRYAGLIETEGKEEISIVGLEAIRGDWTEAAKEFQKKLLMLVFHKKNIKKFIRNYVEDIKSGKMDEKLIYKKSITKSLDSYVKTTPPHVKAARKLDKLESKRIEYYVTSDGPEPIQKLKHKINYDHYIEKQIKPVADSILLLLETNFSEIVQKTKQIKLF